ncbi:MAG: hypothetical protein CMB80_28025 [Flammeovirgaceae bacterium]|nr:hypothetical protein [Flammeovirgaceae bacterium]MBR09085.1 hypothetical protein [Rickettsiales bacterium]|tara:strand:- start:5497 stop:5961 length:465 start_codon:yes stop_codon:yes gene_type:complete
MVKKLFLLRHGHAVSGFNMRDYDRTLSSQGVSVISSLSERLSLEDFNVDLILCSPAIRTMQTCDIMTEGLKYPGKVEYINAIYEATTQQLFLLINQLDDSIDSVLLIGHNPGISYLCDYLQGTNHTEMAPGELIGITMEVERWSEVSKGIGLSL